jgi:toxin ParE1/3/4
VSARYRVIWTESAVRDFEAILSYMTTHGGLLNARRLNEKLDRAISALDTSPARCRTVSELRSEGLITYRELIVRPYRIMFRIYGNEVVLLSVFDGRRDLAELLLERVLGA